MKALLVDDFKKNPHWGTFEDPIAGPDEFIVNVKAAALSNLAKGQANGTHYSSVAKFPFVPGSDGVGRLADGTRVFFASSRRPFGAMAEKTVVSKNLCVELPHSLDDVVAAAIANPVMSSWGALSFRAKLEKGQGVLINGATGSSGALAIKVARYFGAKKIVATGRNPVALNALLGEGADEIISLTQDPQALIQNFRQTLETNQISVILDYLWGASAEALIKAIGGDGSHLSSRKIRFVQIGAMSGPVIPLLASVLRSTGLELVGSGIGSVDLPNLILAIGEGLKVAAELGWKIEMASVPMRDAESAWTQDFGGKRLVFTVDGK